MVGSSPVYVGVDHYTERKATMIHLLLSSKASNWADEFAENRGEGSHSGYFEWVSKSSWRGFAQSLHRQDINSTSVGSKTRK